MLIRLIRLILLAIVGWRLLSFHSPAGLAPVAITSSAVAYDARFWWTLRITGALFIAAQLILAWIIFRRRRVAKSVLPSSSGVWASWLAAAAMIAVEVTLAAHGTSPLQTSRANNPELIEVYVRQFAWNFRYPGPPESVPEHAARRACCPESMVRVHA